MSKNIKVKRKKKSVVSLKVKANLVLLLVLTFIFAYVFVMQYIEYRKISLQVAEYNELIEQEKKETERLNEQLLYAESDAYIEKIAREQLGFVYPNEVIFYNDSK